MPAGRLERHLTTPGTPPHQPSRPVQALSRERPLARRRRMIVRPARVRMRWRNPCLRLRRRLLGWNVRFIAVSSRCVVDEDAAGWDEVFTSAPASGSAADQRSAADRPTQCRDPPAGLSNTSRVPQRAPQSPCGQPLATRRRTTLYSPPPHSHGGAPLQETAQGLQVTPPRSFPLSTERLLGPARSQRVV